MPKDDFCFKKFKINQDRTPMKVGADSVILGAWANVESATYIIDVGTGTGLLALMMAQKYNSALVDAIDIEPDAYFQAKDNVAQTEWKERIMVHHVSWQNYWSKCINKYDLIISNPPFFESSLLSANEAVNLARHQIGLDISDLLKGVVNCLVQNGCFYVVLPYDLRKKALILALSFGLYCNALLKIRPFKNKEFNRIVMKFEKTSRILSEEVLTIYESEKKHTKQYMDLTSDFYLHF